MCRDQARFLATVTAWTDLGINGATKWQVTAQKMIRKLKRVITVVVVLPLLPLGGCSPEEQAPSPTPNPHPHKFSEMKIRVEPGSGVTGVKVESLWNVGNIGCAPKEGWPSGASITKQVNVPETVEVNGADEWKVIIVNDRFLPDKCRWAGGAYNINFMHNNKVLSYGGADPRGFRSSNIIKLTCETDVLVPPAPPVCFMRDREPFIKAHNYKFFNATVEIVR
jgi:hypothetical protein